MCQNFKDENSLINPAAVIFMTADCYDTSRIWAAQHTQDLIARKESN